MMSNFLIPLLVVVVVGVDAKCPKEAFNVGFRSEAIASSYLQTPVININQYVRHAVFKRMVC